MPQAAYDLQMFENRKEQAAPRVRAVKGEKKPSRFNAQKAKWVAVTVLMVSLVCGFLYSQATITELTGQIQTTKKQLVSEQSNYTYLSGVLDSKTSLKNVEQIAVTQLGLVKLDKSQITYFSLEGNSAIRRPESKTKQITEFLTTGMLSLMDHLNP